MPPLVYLNKSNFWAFQTSASFLSSVSMVSSLIAALVISDISAVYWCSLIANMLPRVNVLDSMSNFWPALHKVFQQPKLHADISLQNTQATVCVSALHILYTSMCQHKHACPQHLLMTCWYSSETALSAFAHKVQVLESPLKNIITGSTVNIYL